MRWNDRIGRRIKLSDLHILMAVAQSGSMARAANQLSVSLPVVSRSISELERVLGVRLLERNPRGVELTDYGRAMLRSGNAAFDELRQGVKDIESLADPTVGEVRIATTPPLSASFVSTVIERLGKSYPRIVFHVVIDEWGALLERAADVMICRDPRAVNDERLNFESLFESPYVVAAGARSPWTRRRRIELGELAGEMWALPASDNPVGSFVANVFRAAGLALPRPTVVANALELRANLLRTGRYLSILPEFWLQFPVRHPFIRKLPVVLPASSGPIGVFTLKNRVLNPAIMLFIDCAREVAKPMTMRPR